MIAEALVSGFQVPVRIHEVKKDVLEATKLEAGKREANSHCSAAMLCRHHEFRGHADVFGKPSAGPPHFIELAVFAEISLGADVCPQGPDDLPILQRDHVVPRRIEWFFNGL